MILVVQSVCVFMLILTLSSTTAGFPHSSSCQGEKESQRMGGRNEKDEKVNLEDDDLI